MLHFRPMSHTSSGPDRRDPLSTERTRSDTFVFTSEGNRGDTNRLECHRRGQGSHTGPDQETSPFPEKEGLEVWVVKGFGHPRRRYSRVETGWRGERGRTTVGNTSTVRNGPNDGTGGVKKNRRDTPMVSRGGVSVPPNSVRTLSEGH